MALVAVQSLMAVVAVISAAGNVVTENRGAGAWSRYKDTRFDLNSANRLLVHAVADSTNKSYSKEVRIFLQTLKMHNITFRDFATFDRLAAKDLEHRCYALGQNVARGKLLVNGLYQIFPEAKEHLKLTRRALLSWERSTIPGEGKPFWIGTLWAMVESLFKQGLLYEGLTILFSYDLYAREQDWENLRFGSIHVVAAKEPGAPPEVAVNFGDSKYGKRAKTGSNQPIQVQDHLLRRVLQMMKSTSDDSEVVFPYDQTFFRKAWNKLLVRMNLIAAGGPVHSLRHSKSSHDILAGLASLEEARRRGRWRQLKSAERYSKHACITMHKELLPAEVLRRGEELRADRDALWEQAILEGKAKKKDLGQILHHAVQQEKRWLERRDVANSTGTWESQRRP